MPKLHTLHTPLRAFAVSLLAITMMTPVGCVAQREADDLSTLNRRKAEQIVELEARLEEAQARIRAMQAGTGSADMRRELEQAIADRDRLQSALNAAEQRLRDASLTGPMLPQPLSDALAELAAANPGLMEYDADRGMVKFTSDLTFALGSVEVSQDARNALTRLAGIIRSPVAAEYEVRIVGHTDNVPISRPATRQAHPTNWHLSVHRSIAVKDVLQGAGVVPTRMQVAGYGEHRPVAQNPASGGNTANRRVEIYLTPMPIGAMTPTTAAPAAARASQPAITATPREDSPAQFK